MRTVTIPARFHGPPESGNGGYTCGVAAAMLGEGPARVRLRVPPPLDRPLLVQRRGDLTVLVDGDTVVAEARPAAVDVVPPDPVGHGTAVAALGRFDVDEYASNHAFPSCFTCGPAREPGDGLRLFPADVEGRPGLVASPWVPDEVHAGGDGLIRAEIMWAALDCPSGLVWLRHEGTTGPVVLGEMAASIVRRPSPGDRLVVAGWRIDVAGRKRHSGSVAWTAAGDVIAAAQATWIALAEDQHADFRTAGR